jgi:hypothetical protein
MMRKILRVVWMASLAALLFLLLLALVYYQMDSSFLFDGFQSSKFPIRAWFGREFALLHP